MSYEAHFTEHRKEHLVSLDEGEVVALEVRTAGIQATVRTTVGQTQRFWVTKTKSEAGARRSVVRLKGNHWPTILRRKAYFSVEIGTKVLFVWPHSGQSAYPVVLLEEYLQLLRKTEERRSPDNEPELQVRKGRHRFVD